MKNGYNIGFESKDTTLYIGVYLEPTCKHKNHRKKVGFIDDKDVFCCTDSDLMTLEVMEAIVNYWKVYRHELEESPF